MAAVDPPQVLPQVDAIAAIPDITGDLTFEMVAGGRDGEVYCYSGGLNPYVGIEPDNNNSGPVSVLTIFPNPFSTQTGISFSLAENQPVKLTIYDQTGRMVFDLSIPGLSAPNPTISWDGKDQSGNILPNGMYLIHLQAGNHKYLQKLIKTD